MISQRTARRDAQGYHAASDQIYRQSAMPEQTKATPPPSYSIGQDLDWNAPWIGVDLRVELPFWLIVDDVNIKVEVGGHEFPVPSLARRLNYMAHKSVTPRRLSQGPLRRREHLSNQVQRLSELVQI